MDKATKPLRYAVYMRYSSEMQNDLSLEAQEHRCREEVAKKGGRVVAVFSDAARSGWSLDRDGFQEMLKAASKAKFDAIMFWKFDRLARDNQQVMIIKSMLRTRFGLALHCVEGASEDDEGGINSWFMEQVYAVFSAMFSKSLSLDTKRGKQQRAINGEYNGSTAAFGYDLVVKKDATPQRPEGLYINLREAALVRRAFRLYASGKYSALMVAEWLNQHPYIIKSRGNKQPFGKDTIRDLLRNKLYTGRVSHADTQYKTFRHGRGSSRNRKTWYEGKHDPIITDDLYELAQVQREKLTKTRRTPSFTRTYALHDRVMCSHCLVKKPNGIIDMNYGKMRARWYEKRDYGVYACISRDRGYHKCEQGHIRVDSVDEQVVQALINLEIPIGVRERVENAVRNRVENEELLKHIEIITEKIERIDFKFEEGFMSKEEYIDKRNRLQLEVQSMQPIDYDNLMEAEDLLQNFETYWLACKKQPDPDEARQQLLAKIVQQVYVYNQSVIGIVLYGDFGVIIGGEVNTPTSIVGLISSEIKKGARNNSCTQFGSDGI